MEAVAKYAYTASSPSELSFNAGDTMKVYTLNSHLYVCIYVLWYMFKIIPYDEYWCRGRINGKDGYVPKTYITEKPHP